MTMGTQAKPYGKLLDYEQFIDHQIHRTRRRIKLTDIMTASLTLVVAFLAVLFLEVVFDHVFGLPLFLRRIILTAGLAGASVFAAMRVAMPFLRKINGIYAAKTIEDADPAFKNSLINYLELRRGQGYVSKAIMATLEARAVSDLTQVEVDTVVNQQRLMRTFYALSGVIVIFCMYAAFSPKSILDSTRRAFLADLVRPTNTKLDNIKPGSDPDLSEVVAGAHVPFSVDVQGVRPRQVLLHFSVDGGKFFAVREFTAGRHLYDPWLVTLTSVQQSMDYYLTGGDAESVRYHLEVLPAPTITAISHDLDFPPYTKMPQRANVEGGTVEALEGTTVTVHARTNMPAMAASLIKPGETPIQMGIDADDSTILTGKFKVEPKSSSYVINFRTTGGQQNPSPVTYDINSIPDRPPTAQFEQPDKPAVKVPANVKVDLVATGNDDHGVKVATLIVMSGQETLLSKDLLEGREPQPEFRAKETLDLEQLGLKPGSTIRYKLSVKDNKEPSPNPMETALQLIEVVEPVSPPEKKKLEEAQNNREQAELSRRDEQTDPDQPTQPDGNKDEQQTGTPQGPGKESTGNADQTTGATGQRDGGASDQTPSKDSGGNTQDQTQLTPEEKRIQDAILGRDAKNKPTPPGKNQDGSASSQPKNDDNPNQASKQDPSAPGKNDRPKDESSNDAPRETKPRGKMQEPGRTNPPGDSPKTSGERANDPDNQVQRAEQPKNSPKTDPGEMDKDGKNAKQRQDGQADQRRSGDSGENTKTKGSENSGERSKDTPPGAAGENQGTPPKPRNDSSDRSKSPKNGKDGAGKSTAQQGSDRDNENTSKNREQAGEPKGKADTKPTDDTSKEAGKPSEKSDTNPTKPDGRSGAGDNDRGTQKKAAASDDQSKDTSRGNKDDQAANRSNDTSKDASERPPGKDDKQVGQAGKDDKHPGQAGKDDKQAGQAGKDDKQAGQAGKDDKQAGQAGKDDKQAGQAGKDDKQAGQAGKDDKQAGQAGKDDKQAGPGQSLSS